MIWKKYKFHREKLLCLTIIFFKVKHESFSTFNKGIFSFEAVEVLGHILGGGKSPNPL